MNKMNQFFSMRKLHFFLGIVFVAMALTSCNKDVTSISLDQPTLTLDVGEWKTLTATVLPKNATDKSITWLSQNLAVATVVDGIVTAHASGTAVIIAKAGDHTATCAVTVKSSLTSTNWKGTDTDGDQCTLTFTSVTNCVLSYVGYWSISGTYTLNASNISLKLVDDYGIWKLSGTVIGNQMILRDEEDASYTIYLTKQ